MNELTKKAVQSQEAFKSLSISDHQNRNSALEDLANSLNDNKNQILRENNLDYSEGKLRNNSSATLERLLLTKKSIDAIIDGISNIINLPDPIGIIFDENDLQNGLKVYKKTVPLGVIGVIYESRPNVTIDITALCIKSGNCAILRGGKEAIRTNVYLTRLIRDSLKNNALPQNAIALIENTDRALVPKMLSLKQYIDLIIPRGSAELVKLVGEKAEMPAVTGGIGISHIYIDSDANIEKAVAISCNAKISNPYVCNALDTILVNETVADEFLPKIVEELSVHNVEIKCDNRALKIIGDQKANISHASNDDWGKEFLSLTVSIKTVRNVEEAISHIQHFTFRAGHTDSIITEDNNTAQLFLNQVDSSVVMVNASTRFNDGGQLGMGAEVAISTSKFHARGPMGLESLTSYKWIVEGNGHIRP
ncbi:MAG: glutamate-5-semialdehyde dehydrogenase [SAR202 cluster bacterium]|nr:glutamate-5-semialdehyde dehydrogenase [SAR202 cluster bacterium]|tara:strand:- start:1827 stop:3092 length:1266 start_codon:yes stop_codon:yes gene_type:complete